MIIRIAGLVLALLCRFGGTLPATTLNASDLEQTWFDKIASEKCAFHVVLKLDETDACSSLKARFNLTACPDLCTNSTTLLNQSALGAVADAIPPDDFDTVTMFLPEERAERLRSLDVYIAVIGALVVSAHAPFNEVPPPTKFDDMPRVAIRISGRAWKNKHVMWALYLVVKHMENEQQFLEARFRAMLGDQLLGVGSIMKKDFWSSDLAAENVTISSDAGLTEQHDKVGAPTVSRNDEDGISHSLSWGKETIVTSPRHQELAVELTLAKKSTYSAGHVLRAIMRMIIDAGQYDLLDPIEGMLFYDPEEDFYIIIHATSDASSHKLKGYIVVYTLQTVAGEMAENRAGGVWSIFSGRMRWGGEIVGMIHLKAGKPVLKPDVDPDIGTQIGGTVQAVQ